MLRPYGNTPTDIQASYDRFSKRNYRAVDDFRRLVERVARRASLGKRRLRVAPFRRDGRAFRPELDARADVSQSRATAHKTSFRRAFDDFQSRRLSGRFHFRRSR